MAAGDIIVVEGTTIVFGSEGGDDVNWSTESVSNNAGRQSAQYDLGAGSRTPFYKLRFFTQCQATPVVENTIDVFLKTSNNATLHLDNDDGTGDIAVSAKNKLLNLDYVGSAIVDEAAANVEFVLSVEEYVITARYIHAVMWNASGATSTSDASETKLELTPLTYQVQA